jgi:hypothetical protein
MCSRQVTTPSRTAHSRRDEFVASSATRKTGHRHSSLCRVVASPSKRPSGGLWNGRCGISVGRRSAIVLPDQRRRMVDDPRLHAPSPPLWLAFSKFIAPDRSVFGVHAPHPMCRSKGTPDCVRHLRDHPLHSYPAACRPYSLPTVGRGSDREGGGHDCGVDEARWLSSGACR